LEQFQETYRRVIPEGPMQSLVDLVRKQLDEGMDPARLTFAIRSARPPQNCSDPESKRLVISTPAYKGPPSQIGIAEGAIVITGAGVSATNSTGAPEAWYDPSRKVSISFTAGGKTETETGVMPLRHSVVAGGREYRLTIEEGARSFAKVTFDSCDYP
ncbi:MAG: hypothetical protein K9G62_08930, partial [Alphaproteobacteria bacterium]|nr:hypothetical protein [Alphaproteobacteria bacterium]